MRKNPNIFNHFNKERVIQDRYVYFVKEHGEDHVIRLGGEDAVKEMLEADYDLAKAERASFDWRLIKERLQAEYKVMCPELTENGFFDEAFTKKGSLPAIS